MWVGHFEVMAPFTLLDFSGSLATDEFPLGDRHFAGYLLARPAHQRDPAAYYLTQYLGQRIRAAGFAGVAYDSLLHRGGTNIALFDPEKHAIRMVRLENISVTRVLYETQILRYEARATDPV